MPRAAWSRFRPEVPMDLDAVRAVLADALPGAEVLGFAAVAGGLANTNLDVTLAGPPHRVVLRVYQRDPAQAAKEVALAERLRLPAMPAVLHFAAADRTLGHPCAVMEFRPGVRLETRAPDAAIARAAGAALAAIHAVRFDAHGFFGADLVVAEPVDLGREGLLAFLRRQLLDGPGAGRLGADLTARLFARVEAEGDLLETWLAAPCLVHGDFNGSNILVDRGAVTAVVDWEFAFAGSPATDFGNLLRPPMDKPDFSEAVAAGYVAAGGVLPRHWRRIAALADVYSWADFLGRPAPGEALLSDARTSIEGLLASPLSVRSFSLSP